MFLWKLLRYKFLMVVWLCVIGLPAAGLIWVKEHHPELVPSVLMWFIIPGFLFCSAGSFFICLATSRHMDDDLTMSLWAAVKLSYGDFRALLSFVPVIGRLFEPDEDKAHYDPEDD
jgi:hypothetical protein